MAIEANTSIKPNIIGLLSAGNEKKVSHENSRFFSPLRLTAIKKIKNKKSQFSLTTKQVLKVSLHKNILWSSHMAAGFLFPSGTFVWFSLQKAKAHNRLYPVLWHLHSYITMALEKKFLLQKNGVSVRQALVLPWYNTEFIIKQMKIEMKDTIWKNVISMQYGTGCMSNLVVTQTSPLKYIIRQALLSASPR